MESACNRKRKLSSVDGADDKSELSDTDDDGSKKFIGDNLQNTNSDEEDLDDNGNERIINDALESQQSDSESEGDGDSDEDDDEEDPEENKENDLCPICLGEFQGQMIGIPENCKHVFCADCIQEWTKNVNNCPVDRKKINKIFVHANKDEPAMDEIPVVDKVFLNQFEEEPPTYCEICNQCDREEVLLLCDECDRGFHVDCLTPPLTSIPEDEWFCEECNPQDKPSTSKGPGQQSEDFVARNLMYGQLRQRARTVASNRRDSERQARGTTRSQSRRRRRTPRSASNTASPKRKRKKRSRKTKGATTRTRKGIEKAKKKAIQKELKRFREEKDKDCVKEVSKSLAVCGDKFDLDDFYDPDDENFCYEDQREDKTPRSTICDTPDVIGNILGGFGTLDSNNVKVLRDGTIKPNEKKSQSENVSYSSKAMEEETCIIIEPKRSSSSGSSHTKEIVDKNKKRRKIRFLDEAESGYQSDNEVFVDPETNKKVSHKLKKGYFEAMKKKKENEDLKKRIEEMKKKTFNTNVNHHASLFSVKTFKIPKKAKSNAEADTSPKKELKQNDKIKCDNDFASDQKNEKEVFPNKSFKTLSVSSSPKKLNFSSLPTSSNTDVISSIISKAKKTMIISKESSAPCVSSISKGTEKNQKLSSKECFHDQSKRLSAVVDQRRNHVPEQRKKVFTLEEKIAMHNVGKFKNIRSATEVSPKKSSASLRRASNPAEIQRRLRSIIKVRPENSCKPLQAPSETSVLPKKPISLEKYKERKLLDDLFGVSPKVEEKNLQDTKNKTVSFSVQGCSKSEGTSHHSDDTVKENPFGKLVLKPPSEKKLPMFSNVNGPIPPPIKQPSSTSPWSNLPSSNKAQNSSRPVGIVTPHQRVKTETKEESVKNKPLFENKRETKKNTDSSKAGVSKSKKPSTSNANSKETSEAASEEYIIVQVKEYMKPFFNQKKVSKEQWKTIVKEAVHKIKKHPTHYNKKANFIKLMENLIKEYSQTK